MGSCLVFIIICLYKRYKLNSLSLGHYKTFSMWKYDITPLFILWLKKYNSQNIDCDWSLYHLKNSLSINYAKKNMNTSVHLFIIFQVLYDCSLKKSTIWWLFLVVIWLHLFHSNVCLVGKSSQVIKSIQRLIKE